jgi:acyl-CoA dehydrogenase
MAVVVADSLLVDTIHGLLADHCPPERIGAAEGGIDATLWTLLEESGLTLVGIAETKGGSGGTVHDQAAIVKACGYHAAPVPLAETFHAASVLASRSEAIPVGPMAVASAFGPHARAWYGGGAQTVITATGTRPGSTDGRNYAGEPYADLAAVDAVPGADLLGALHRSLLVAGACARVVELSVQYAQEREQFGKPIGRFQILQHYLAEMVGEAAMADAAADNAVDALAAGASTEVLTRAVAGAKVLAGRASGTITRLAHQLHGAIGYTDEHRLQYWTRRLWSWRDEYGSEHQWASVLGASMAQLGPDALWPTVTTWPPAVG